MKRQTHNPDTLADRLDMLIPPGQPGPIRQDEGDDLLDDPLIETAARLANAPHPQLSPAAMQRIQREMLAAQKPVYRPQFVPAVRLLVAAASIFLVLVLTLPIIGASLPGEPLYQAKRALEQMELTTARLLQNETDIRLHQAERRVTEATILVRSGEFPADVLDEVFTHLDAVVDDVQPQSSDETTRLVQISDELYDVVTLSLENNLASAETLAVFSNRLNNLRSNNPGLFPARQPLLLLSPEPPVQPSRQPSVEPSQEPVEETPQAPAEVIPDTLMPTVTPTEPPTHTPTPTPVLSPTPTPQPPATASGAGPPAMAGSPGYVVGNGRVNVRQEPGTGSPVIAVVQPGEPITIIGQNDEGNWSNVRLQDGLEGWIANFLVQVGGQPPAPVMNPPDDAGRPDDPGNSGDAGRPDDPGNSGDAGRPDDPGNSGDAGRPDDAGPPVNPGGPGDTGRPDNPGNSNPPGQTANPGGGRP